MLGVGWKIEKLLIFNMFKWHTTKAKEEEGKTKIAFLGTDLGTSVYAI